MGEDTATAQLYPPFSPAEGTIVLSSQTKLMEPSLGVPGFSGCTQIQRAHLFPSLGELWQKKKPWLHLKFGEQVGVITEVHVLCHFPD